MMKIKQVVIYYFSGTSNAKNSAIWIADEALKNAISAEIVNIDNVAPAQISPPAENTLIGFCSPTHGFHFPLIMRKFISRFPTAKNCHALVINTRAGLKVGRFFLPGLSGLVHY